MRLLLSTVLLVCVSTICVPTNVGAHHPDRENQPVRPRIEVIPPLGTSLRMSHRRQYNRPSNWMGKIAYHIAPSSQEAMAWHSATHRGLYENDRPRIVTHYFYPKPWEALKIGPRPRTTDLEAGAEEISVPLSPSDQEENASVDVEAETDPAGAEVIPPPAEASEPAETVPSPSDTPAAPAADLPSAPPAIEAPIVD